MERISSGEDIPRLIDGKKTGDLIPMFDDPIGILAHCFFTVIRQAAPLEESAADNL